MMNTSFEIDWLTADLHLGHKYIISKAIKQSHGRDYETLEEHDAMIEDNWNSVVKPHHTVAVLGDVVFQPDRFEILKRLNGTKILVMGNHDDYYPTSMYLESFAQIYGALKYKREFMLTHVPIHPEQFETRYKYNIHGHLHSDSIDDPRYLCVSVDQHDFKPVSFEEVASRLRQR